jgi:hypothetical protein
MLNFTTGSTPAVATVNGTKFVGVEGDLGTSVTVEWSENGVDKWIPLVSEVNTPAALTVPQGVLFTSATGSVRLTMVGTGNCNYAISDIRQR